MTRVGKYMAKGFTRERAQLEARREAMRIYMERRRRDPAYREEANRARIASYHRNKLGNRSDHRKIDESVACEFCRSRRSVTMVERLTVRRGEFVPVKMRYCGRC